MIAAVIAIVVSLAIAAIAIVVVVHGEIQPSCEADDTNFYSDIDKVFADEEYL